MDETQVVRIFQSLWALDRMQLLAVAAVPLIFAITVHEAAHGWVAKMRGDRTAQMLGRLTLNPVPHIDPVGTLLVPGLMLMFTGFIFGWAKPVPVTQQNLRGGRRDMAMVAAAGPASNLVMAFIWTLLLGTGAALHGAMPGAGQFLFYMGAAGVLLNTILAVLNMLPIPPLDGGRVVSSLLPGPVSWQFDRIEPFGIFIVLGLLVLGLLGKIILPVVIAISTLLLSIIP